MCRIMIDLLGPHGTNDAHIVGHTADVGEQLADFRTRLAKPFEPVLWPKADKWLPLQLSNLLTLSEGLRHRLAVHLSKFWFRVQRLKMRRPSCLIQKDHAFRLC